jgi:hypothetical protein
VTFVQAVGGAVAVVAGVFMTRFIGQASSGSCSLGRIFFEDSRIIMARSLFTNCAAESLTDSSLGSSSVFGGAFALLHSPQVSNFEIGLLMPTKTPAVTGFNLTVLVSKSSFILCSASSNASSGFLGEANGRGGSVYTNSISLTNFNVTESTFSSNRVTVAGGVTGLPSFSSGGALAVEAGAPNVSSVAISFSDFLNCTVQGANISSMAVRGGAIHVSRATNISVINVTFAACSVSDAVSGAVVSGGSSMTAVVSGGLSVIDCVFDASGGQDTSETSTGLLVLARNSSRASVNMSRCRFIATTVVLLVRCVDEDGARSIDSCVGPNIVFGNSHAVQVSPQPQEKEFIASGSNLMSFQNPESISFTGSRMRCALSQFAAFKEQSITDITSSSSITDYSCRPCQPFQISLAATEVSLQELSNAKNVDRCFPVSNSSVTSGCPFAIADCTTFVRVSIGFWTNILDSGELEEKSRRCPRGYCGCISPSQGACPLPPPISIDRNSDPLCNGNRTGKLCGGCRPDFTQSLDDRSCVSNEDCRRNLWWVWTLSILGFAAYSLYIVVSCHKMNDGAFSCLVFYFQMSSFADNSGESNALATIIEYSQARSIAALFSGTCYAPSLSAYNATALKLIGPLFVLVFAVAWTWIIHKLQPRLQQRSIDISVSFSGSVAVAILFVFSNVTSIVCALVECTSYSGSDGVVFIDGTVPCKDSKWAGLVFIAALLFLFPAVFAAALHLNKLPQSARDALCAKFTAPMFYWGAATLAFRLLISFTQFLRVDFPNLLALVRLLLSTGALMLLMNLRPYVHDCTFWVDATCYACLIAQFGLQVFSADREFLGVAQSLGQQTFLRDVSISSTVFRRDHCALFSCCRLYVYMFLPLQVCARRCFCYGTAGLQVSFRKRVEGNLQTHCRACAKN